MRRLKLGILQVNHDRSIEVGDAFPDDAHRFRDLFDTQEQRFEYRVYMTVGGEVPQDVDEQDAYLITGSPESILHDLTFLDSLYDFIRRADAARKPLLGVCFGHQAIAMALGGTVEQSDWNIGVETHTFLEHFDWMQPAQEDLNLHSFPHDTVTVLPDGCRRIAESPGCVNAGFAKGDHIITTQGHPEFTDRFMAGVLDATKHVLSATEVEVAEARAGMPSDGDVFATWATRFFGGTP
mgnify:FL=1